MHQPIDSVDYHQAVNWARRRALSTKDRLILWHCPLVGWLSGTRELYERCRRDHGWRQDTWED